MFRKLLGAIALFLASAAAMYAVADPLTPAAVVDGVGWSGTVQTTIQRPNNTTAYAANQAYATAGASYSILTGACRFKGFQVLIPQIDIASSANQSTKMQGILWLFKAPPSAGFADQASFILPSADFANLTGNVQGFPFTMTNNQAAGAGQAGITLAGTTWHAICGTAVATGTLYAMVQVTNAYTPVANEVLTIRLHTLAVN